MDTELSLDILLRFWAKTTHDKDRHPNAYHPLLCHMIDVAMVANIIWDRVLSTATKKRIASVIELSIDEAGKLISWIAGLHDLGKASPPFAHRKTEQNIYKIYDETKFRKIRDPQLPKCAPHGYVTAVELPDILVEQFGCSRSVSEQLSVIIGGHHGVFPRSENLNNIEGNPELIGGKSWRRARQQLVIELAKILIKQLKINIVKPIDNASSMMLAGLVSVADWIGSNTDYFKCKIEDQYNIESVDLLSYTEESYRHAERALSELGWLGWAEVGSPRSFSELFAHISNPNSLQNAVENLAPSLTSQGIVVIEAPMGEGKTEAAMFLADYWNATLKQRGIYFALPTQATSNQMFGRVKNFLRGRYSQETILLQLMHGHASLSAEFQTLLKKGHEKAINIEKVYVDEYSCDCTPSVMAAEWFTYRKRGLLAPFGVGTVDQALLAVLQTRHVFVRLFGLANKTVIIDEVHAYDAYMSVLLKQLLTWLAALGSPVILLSATLPTKKRDELVGAYLEGLNCADGQVETKSQDYPVVTWATKEGRVSCHIQTSKINTRTLHLKNCKEGLSSLGQELQKALADGGCAAVICNTVHQAQEVFKSLKPYFPDYSSDGLPELDLLHARFIYKDRYERELRALIRFGKEGAVVTDDNGQEHSVVRPDRAILVSTQIIEQSLDLDFDLMVSEHAPVDLLLQRSGRLHRHARRYRPPKLIQPTLWLIPNNPDDRLDFGTSANVYDEHVLFRSYLALKERDYIRIPEDVSELIESVYDDRECPDKSLSDKWEVTAASLRKKHRDKTSNASSKKILSPNTHFEDFFENYNLQLEEDNPEFHRTLQASTRDDESPSIQIIVLKEHEKDRVNPKNLSDTRWLLERSVPISNRSIVFDLIKQEPEPSWKENSLLRHHRLLVLDSADEARIGSYSVRLDKSLGLVITKLQEEC